MIKEMNLIEFAISKYGKEMSPLQLITLGLELGASPNGFMNITLLNKTRIIRIFLKKHKGNYTEEH